MGGILLLSLFTGLVIYTIWAFYPYINAKVQLYLLKYSGRPTLEEFTEIGIVEDADEPEEAGNPPNKVLLIFQKYFDFYTHKIYDFVWGV